MKMSEFTNKNFLNNTGAIANSYVLINYEDNTTSGPTTYKTSLDTLGKAIATNLKLLKANSSGNLQYVDNNYNNSGYSDCSLYGINLQNVIRGNQQGLFYGDGSEHTYSVTEFSASYPPVVYDKYNDAIKYYKDTTSGYVGLDIGGGGNDAGSVFISTDELRDAYIAMHESGGYEYEVTAIADPYNIPGDSQHEYSFVVCDESGHLFKIVGASDSTPNIEAFTLLNS